MRLNPDRTKHMITLEDEIDSQIKWIQEYKKREKEGLDFYLIYCNNEDKPIGLNRISHVDYKEKTAKASSWIAVEGLINEAFKMSIIQSEIAFGFLNVETIQCDVHNKNSNVIKLFKLFGYKFKDIGTEYYHFSITKQDFFKTYDNRLTKLFLQNLQE